MKNGKALEHQLSPPGCLSALSTMLRAASETDARTEPAQPPASNDARPSEHPARWCGSLRQSVTPGIVSLRHTSKTRKNLRCTKR